MIGRRSFLQRALAGVAALFLPKLPPAAAKPVPTGISLPFGTLPLNTYIRGPRYRVIFGRLDTPRFTAAVDEAVNKAAIDKAIVSDYIIPYRVIPKGL